MSSPSGESFIEARGMTVGYGRLPVLEGVELRIAPGEFWFFLGPNGHGKSTLLKAILGMVTPFSGTMRLNPIVADRRRLAFVPQRCDLNPSLPMTVHEFVRLGLVGIRADRADAEQRLGWALDRVGLGGLTRRSYWSLSGGQRQRALVARALIRRPLLLILDEPTNGLDVAAEEALIESLDALNREEALTIILVTHHLALAAAHGSHVALVARGTVSAGPRRTVMTAEFVARTFEITPDVAHRALRHAGEVGGRRG